jgi:hypothetical protein
MIAGLAPACFSCAVKLQKWTVISFAGRYAENPSIGMQTILKGMTLQPAQSFDHFFTIDVTLFYQAREALRSQGSF